MSESGSPSSALEHPLPAGMRDLLPDEARTLSALGRRIMGAFALHGYERVTLPVFEYAEVLERGLGALDPREVLRFVEPETGEVVALRPDMTPQIARIVATRLRDEPGPARLCYEGSVVRLRRGRARRHRQIPQAGVELIGATAPDGDLEVLEVATAAVRAAGLEHFVLDLGHARVAGALIETGAPPHRRGLVEALMQKDPVELARRASRAQLAPDLSRALVALTELHGQAELWPEAERVLANTPAAPALAELHALWQIAQERGLAPELGVDLGEVRDLGYYTGVTFQILATGPGEPVGSGGRYDGLLGQFGAPRAAAGFALSLDDVTWALGAIEAPRPARVLCAVAKDARSVLDALRAGGAAAALAPPDALGHARAFRYSHLLSSDERGATLKTLADGREIALPGAEPRELARAALAEISRSPFSLAPGTESPQG